ncbi:MAG TPA: ABC transporter permease [Gemmatimonadales bacterium]|jgi:predicted permease
MIDTLVRDLRYAIRSLRRRPLFTAVAVITLGLGVGANTAIFSVVNGVMLRPLAYDHPEQLVQIVGAGTGPDQQSQFSFPDFRDLRSESHGLSSVAAFRYWLFNLSGSDHPESMLGVYIGDSLFRVLRVHPALGRGFAPGVEGRQYPAEAVISDGLWRRRFGADPHLPGRTIRLDGKPVVVVGILPRAFQFPDLIGSNVPLPSRSPDIFMPIGPEPINDMTERSDDNYSVIGRLANGAALAGVNADEARIAATLAKAYPDNDKHLVLRAAPLQEEITGEARRPLLILFGAVGLVLLIACANVGGLLLARAVEREREISIRTALGASPGRLRRQLLTESLLLGLLGGTLGVILASWGVALLRASAPNNIPRIDQVTIDARVLAFALIGSLVTALIFGLAPVLQQRGSHLALALREREQRGSSASRRARGALVVIEVALAVVLLTGAGLLLRSFASLGRVSLGFDGTNVMTMFTLLPPRYNDSLTGVFERRIVDDLNQLPGVVSAAAINTLPLTNLGDNTSAEAADHPIPAADRPMVDYRVIAGPYFHTMRMPIVAGRDFATSDTHDAPPVAIINQAAARRFFPGVDPVGRKIRLMNGDTTSKMVVGVVADVHTESLEAPAKPEVSAPSTQMSDPVISLAIRTRGDPHLVLPAIRRSLAAADPDRAFYAERTIDDLLGASLATRKFNLALLGGFAALALILASVGLYGVIAFSVSQRTREIGIRTALGAARGSITGLVLGEGARLGGAGLVLGILGSVAATRAMRGMLFHVTPTDPLTLVAVACFLAMIVGIACYLPARRAARIDPIDALRGD